eukprot:COSAG01_NODE_66454_length_270_cov_0.602339_2_plen_36_part_01
MADDDEDEDGEEFTEEEEEEWSAEADGFSAARGEGG